MKTINNLTIKIEGQEIQLKKEYGYWNIILCDGDKYPANTCSLKNAVDYAERLINHFIERGLI